MNPTLVIQVFLLVLLLVLSGFFSSAETALFSLKRNHRQEISDQYPKRASVIERLLAQPRSLIIALLIGNESVNVVASAISTAIILSIFGEGSAYLNLFLMVPLLLLFGEITPKSLAIRNNIKFAIFQAPLIDKFTWLSTPIRGIVRSIADRIITLLIGKERSEGNLITEDMMRTLAADALQKGALDSTEAKMIHQIFDFGNVTAQDIMTPRSDLSSMPLELSMPQCLENFAGHRHTKIPVVGKNRDDIIGILFVRELMAVDLTDDKRHLYDYKQLLRAPYFVPETKSGADLFKVFRDKKISIAIVVDEYGGVVGLVTMEDLLETIFGDIYSPSEEDARSSFSIEDGRYIVDGIMEINDFNTEFSTNLSEQHVETIGGLIFHALGELPDEGDSVRFEGLELVVISMRDNRISDIEIKFDTPPKLEGAK